MCTYCKSEVVEEAASVPRQDNRTLMVKFNEQMEPIFGLLHEVEDIKLAPEILEPEPTDLSKIRYNTYFQYICTPTSQYTKEKKTWKITCINVNFA